MNRNNAAFFSELVISLRRRRKLHRWRTEIFFQVKTNRRSCLPHPGREAGSCNHLIMKSGFQGCGPGLAQIGQRSRNKVFAVDKISRRCPPVVPIRAAKKLYLLASLSMADAFDGSVETRLSTRARRTNQTADEPSETDPARPSRRFRWGMRPAQRHGDSAIGDVARRAKQTLFGQRGQQRVQTASASRSSAGGVPQKLPSTALANSELPNAANSSPEFRCVFVASETGSGSGDANGNGGYS